MRPSLPTARLVLAGLILATAGQLVIAAEPLVRLPVAAKLPDDWNVVGKPQLVNDPLLGRDVYEIAKGVLQLTSPPIQADEYEVEALVRFSGDKDAGGVQLSCGVNTIAGKASLGYTLRVSRSGPRTFGVSPSVGDGTLRTLPKAWQSAAESIQRRSLRVTERYPLDSISPVWDEDLRLSVENDMAKIPLEKDVWRRVRIEVRADRVRMYHNDLLALDEPNAALAEGSIFVGITGPARLAGMEVRRLAPSTAGYEPVPIGDVCNAAGLVDPKSLPASGASVAGIPLLLPHGAQGGDHIDVGASLFRYRKTEGPMGASPRESWPTPMQRDPGRIMLRVPRGTYRRLWVLAAADGEPNNLPLLTARFFKPHKGWPIDAAANVPELGASSSGKSAKAVAVKRADGKPGNLWLVPLELDTAAIESDQREENVLNIELTKGIQDYRAFPDPMYYGSFQAGLPSSVRIFALTLEKAPVGFIASGNRSGSIYTHPEQPVWSVALSNRTEKPQSVAVRIEITSPYGQRSEHEQVAQLTPEQSTTIEHKPKLAEFGLYKVRTTVTCSDHTQSREGSFLTLPPDTRRTTAANSRWGLWSWGGGHGTNPNHEEELQQLKSVGSQIGGHIPYKDRLPWQIGPCPTLAFRGIQPWAKQDPYDEAGYQAYADQCGREVLELLKKTPDVQYVSIFAENMVSLRVTHGNPPEAFGKSWWDYTDEEKQKIRGYLLTAKAAFEGVRKAAPKIKFLYGHCGPLFSLPIMKDKYPPELFDGYGLDSPQFERMPERPPRAVEPSQLFFLKQEMQRSGYKKELVHTESYYPSSHPLALGHRGSADSLVRTAVLAMAHGSDRFLANWSLHDCEDEWGSQHYGCIGLLSRRPEYNPKPAAPAFATLTQLIDTAKYDGYVPTGSRSEFCVRFKDGANLIYAMWTIRGTRPATLSMKPVLPKKPVELALTDENGNERPLPISDGQATVTLAATPVWVTAKAGAVSEVKLGTPVHTEKPSEHRVLLDDFERADWKGSAEPYDRYAKNSWDWQRDPAAMKSERVKSSERSSTVWQVSLPEQSGPASVAGRYTVFTPPADRPIPGKAMALGVYARGNSGWGRIVYEVVDAKGEIFQSIGMKDEWNCDDTHSWSNFNFDGWRYLEFPLPSSSPGDDYREKDSVWWNHSADGVVDLPLKLNKIIVEMPTHVLYVEEFQPVADRTIELDDLVAVYDSAELLTDAPVKVQRAAAGMLKPRRSDGAVLPNPIANLRTEGVGAATKITKVYPPAQEPDGTKTHVAFQPVAGAAEYQVWVAAYPDGQGAMIVGKSTLTEPLVTRLRPGMPLYFFVTYTDAAGKTSQPSAGYEAVLKDEFLQK